MVSWFFKPWYNVNKYVNTHFLSKWPCIRSSLSSSGCTWAFSLGEGKKIYDW